MGELCEFEFVPRKRAVQDSVAQIGNHTSTALNCWRNGELSDGSIGSNTSKGKQRCTILLDTRTSSRRRLQYQEGKELRRYWKGANHCFSTTKLFKLREWYSTRPWIPQSTTRRRLFAYDGSGERLQPRHVHRDPMQIGRHWHRNTGTETGTETETDSCQY